MTLESLEENLDSENNIYYLDKHFEIAAISDLSHRERAAFKPIYSMNKWWARRSSAVFRAILLGLALPTGADLIEEFYQNHQNENLKNKIVLDPFMGGGTTVVEAARLGHKAIGIDLNPLSWFIVKTETTKVSIESLQEAFERLESAIAESIASMYSTLCPCCGNKAEIIYAFWAKIASCMQDNCGKEVLMSRDFVIGQRRGVATIRYHEVQCPNCELCFDWEQERATIVPGSNCNSYLFAKGKNGKAWSLAKEDGTANCPNCSVSFTPSIKDEKLLEKKTSLYALLCPNCEEIHPHRGEIPEQVDCPQCLYTYNPRQGTTERGAFICSNGHKTAITDAARKNENPLGFRMYAIEGFCPTCSEKRKYNNSLDVEPKIPIQLTLGEDFLVNENTAVISKPPKNKKTTDLVSCPNCRLVNHKFFKKPDERDLALYEESELEWEERKKELPYPQESINDYEKTNRLVIHNYQKWHQLFNPRQLLVLSKILKQILLEPKQDLKEALIAAFLGTIEHQNMLNIYYVPYAQSAGAFGRHDFHPKVMACEGNPWGGSKGRGTFLMAFGTVVSGKSYLLNPYEAKYTKNGSDKIKRKNVFTGDTFSGAFTKNFTDLSNEKANMLLHTGDSRDLSFIPNGSIDHVVTDPPYADAVQYSEMSDFFYVWLRLALKNDYPELFKEPETPKTQEIVENVRRRKSQSDFYQGLQQVFTECYRILKPEGRLVFTFHHSKGEQWSELLNVILRSGFMLNAVYPVKSEATESGNLVFHSNSSSSIAYDIIHVCQKVSEKVERENRAPIYWQELVPNISQQVRSHIKAIKAQGDTGRRLAASDVRIMLWGECLAVYSHAAGKVLDSNGEPMEINSALKKATELVEEILTEQHLI